jgi:hypothetical protein
VIASTAAVRQAHGLVDRASAGALDNHLRDLIAQAKVNPMRMVELSVLLAEMVAALQPREPAALHAEYLRHAHAAYTRGDRFGWVISAEREYQRLKKRRLRKGASA